MACVKTSRILLLLLLQLAANLSSGGETTKLAELVQLSDEGGAPLRQALFGGAPHLIWCDSKESGWTQERDHLRQLAAAQSEKQAGAQKFAGGLKIASLPCGKKMSKRLGLKRRKGFPNIVLAVNGDRPQQLQPAAYTTAVKDGKTGEVVFDSKKLVRYLEKKSASRVGRLESNTEFKKDCLARKHQWCGVVLHHGTLSAAHKTLVKSLATRHRRFRLYAVDVEKYDVRHLPLLPAPRKGADPKMVLFRQRPIGASSKASGSHAGGVDDDDSGGVGQRGADVSASRFQASMAGDRLVMLVREGADEDAKRRAFDAAVIPDAAAFLATTGGSGSVGPSKGVVFSARTQKSGGRSVYLDWTAVAPLLAAEQVDFS